MFWKLNNLAAVVSVAIKFENLIQLVNVKYAVVAVVIIIVIVS